MDGNKNINIMIVGGNYIGKGAEAMMLVVRDEIRKIFPKSIFWLKPINPEEAEKLKEKALSEKRVLDEYEAAMNRLEKESENLAGKVAFRALDDVREKFYRLVLDADVGVLDVVWSRKMKVTRKISELTRRQGSERKRLLEEFKGVLKEVK